MDEGVHDLVSSLMSENLTPSSFSISSNTTSPETSNSSPEMRMETQLTVITLNCWGIAGVSKNRIPRMQAIATELASGKYDFAFLQEVWTTEDYERIKGKAAQELPYSHYFFSGVIGAGICIFSRSPITAAFFHQWAVNGYVHKIQHGDWFGGKGIGMVQVLHKGLKCNLYTTHLHAEYDRVNDEYLAHRVTQAYDTAQFITLTSHDADVVIVGGDLNTEPGDLAYRVIMHTAQLRDSCFEAPRSTDGSQQYTCETPDNSYTKRSVLKSNPFGKRIDYVVYKPGTYSKVSTVSCSTPLPKLVPGQSFSYSDHEAVVAQLKIVKSETVQKQVITHGAKKEALEESIEICSQALRNLAVSKKIYYGFGLICFLLLLMASVLELQDTLAYILTLARVLTFLALIFCVFMCAIWNRMEVHGILAGKLGMELELVRPADGLVEDYIAKNDERWLNIQSGENPPVIKMPKFK